MLRIKIYKSVEGLSIFSLPPYERLVAEYPVRNFTANYQIGVSPSFSFELDFSQLSNFPFVPTIVYSFQLYRFGELLYTGLVESFSIDYVKRSVKFNCEDRLFYLSFFRPTEFARINNNNITSILRTILDTGNSPFPSVSFDGNVTLREFSTGIPNTAVTVDTTNDENLLGQALRIVNTLPGWYLKSTDLPTTGFYPGGSTPTLLAAWGYTLAQFSDTPIFTIDPANIVNFTTEVDQSPALHLIEPYGAEYDAAGTPAIIDLTNKTIADISGYTSNTVNNTVTNDAYNALDASRRYSVVKIFDEVKPKSSSSPPIAHVRNAANMLYRKAVRYLKEYGVTKRYNLSLNQDLAGIEIGNRVRIEAPVTVPMLSPQTAEIQYISPTNLDPSGVYYVESIRTSYLENEVKYDLVVVETADFLPKDQDVKAYNAKKQQKIKTYNVTTPGTAPHGYYETTIGPGLAANCGTGSGRSVSFTKSAGDFGGVTAPGATAAADLYYIDIKNLTNTSPTSFFVTIDPTVVGATFAFCVSVNGAWTTSDSVRVRVLLQYP